MKISIVYYPYKMNIKTNLLEEYVNFVDNTKKQNNCFKNIILLIMFILSLFLFFSFYLNISMTNAFSLQQIGRTSNLDANLISCKNELNLMADFMLIKNENPTLKQSQIADQLGYSSTLQRYRNDINMLSP